MLFTVRTLLRHPLLTVFDYIAHCTGDLDKCGHKNTQSKIGSFGELSSWVGRLGIYVQYFISIPQCVHVVYRAISILCLHAGATVATAKLDRNVHKCETSAKRSSWGREVLITNKLNAFATQLEVGCGGTVLHYCILYHWYTWVTNAASCGIYMSMTRT